MQTLTDSFGRTIDYLRISLTDKCNLRCRYCMPPQGINHIPHQEILSFEEIVQIVRVLAGLGLKKVRLTGGEPLVRRNIVSLIKLLSDIPGIEEICLVIGEEEKEEFDRFFDNVPGNVYEELPEEKKKIQCSLK